MISAVVLTKNEEKNISKCLTSLSWCDELIIIDDHSTDRTIDIAKKTNAKIYQNLLNGNFAQQRNFGLNKASGDWVLFVDADEIVSPALWYEIMQYTNNSIDNNAGFFIKRKDVMWGKELNFGETGDVKLLRIAKKEAGTWTGAVHEVWNVTGNTALLNNSLMHFPHQNIAEFINDVNFYTDLRAKDLQTNGTSVSSIQIILFPLAKFFKNFIFKQGFRDGIPGLLVALVMSFHSFLVRSKLWQLNKKQKKK
ncbi:MAG TPA: glycosyltransferase family 2 protein [Candidatus Saccharimonadales bacterium]|nr:glycosyltransferase family 2 protein [Candidatus Saccharimonadales bacterium]